MQAAIDLADTEGLDGLTVRRLAAAAGVAPVTIYSHVSGIDEVFDLAATKMVEEELNTIQWPDTWPEVLRLFARTIRHLVDRHPAYLAAAQRRPIMNPAALEVVDVVVGALRKAGMGPAEASTGYLCAYSYTVGFCSMELGRADVRAREGRIAQEDRARVVATLVESGLQNLTDCAEQFGDAESDAQFEHGLDLIISGLAKR